MKSFVAIVTVGVIAGLLPACTRSTGATKGNAMAEAAHVEPAGDRLDKVVKSDEEWRRVLTPEQYRVTREGGTECAFTGEFYKFKGEGTFRCVCCGSPLFESSAKFESGTGWPSFWRPVSETSLTLLRDASHGMVRTEVRCRRCDAHLGHVFEDGPPPTGLRFCFNSAALRFEPKKP